MRTLGILTQDAILVIERANGQEIAHNALALSLTMHPRLAGADGQPAVSAIFLDDAMSRLSGSADWHLAVKRQVDVVHYSHPDWEQRRVSYAYMEIPRLEPRFITAARAAHEAERVARHLLGEPAQPAWTSLSDDEHAHRYSAIVAALGGGLEPRPSVMVETVARAVYNLPPLPLEPEGQGSAANSVADGATGETTPAHTSASEQAPEDSPDPQPTVEAEQHEAVAA